MILFFVILSGCKPEYMKFDNNLPGETSKLFAKDVIALNGEYTGYCAFNKDGSEFYYAITDSNWASSKILRIKSSDINKKDTLYLKDKRYEGEPFITQDGMTMFFTVILPPKDGEKWQSDIYMAHKKGNQWENIEKLDSIVNSTSSEWHISMTHNNVTFFTSEREKGTSALFGDIYRADFNGKGFANLKKLPYPINTEYNDSDPLIAPDESFLIFHSNRPGGFGEHDLYISFNEHGHWTDPKNMGPAINTTFWEMAPTLTPDGKYLLFTRRKAIVTNEPAQIYWVSSLIINELR